MLEKQTISNDLVKLIPLIKEDYEWVYAAASDPEIWAQHPDRMRYTPLGFTVYFKKLLETTIPYLIIDKKTETVIGATSFYDQNVWNKSIAIGYTFLVTARWGGIYNASLKKLMIDYAYEAGFEKIIFHVRKGNLRSQRALAKIGAQFEEEYPAQDGSGVQVLYAIYKQN